MGQTKEKIQQMLLFVGDMASILGAFYLSGYLWLVVYKGFSWYNTMQQLNSNVLTVIVAGILTCLLCSNASGFMVRGAFEEFREVAKESILLGAATAIYELLRRDGNLFPRGVYVLTVLIAALLALLLRILIKRYLLSYGQRTQAVRMVMVATKTRAEQTLSTMRKKEEWLHQLVALVIIDQDLSGTKIGDIPVTANVHTMMAYLKNEAIDEVYLNIGAEARESFKPYVMEMEDMGLTVHMKIELLENYSDFDATLGQLGQAPVITFANRIYDYRELAVKRCIDIAGSIVGMVIMALAMIFVAPAIKLESPGPLFFKQKRVGKNGRYFYIYKFRSMYIDAEERKKELMAQNEMSGLMFKMKDDPRITKVGKFIRKTSIDELPQFLNVFRGEMSLVGTRPPTVNEFQLYQGHHKRRLSMKPGITGMWQAYGRKTVTDFEEVVKMDLDYIDHWNLLLDIKILCKTVQVVLTDGGQ